MIKEIELEAIPGYFRPGKVQKELLQFHKSGWVAAEVDPSGYSSANSCQSAYKHAIEKLRLNTIICISRQNRVFLIRETQDERDVADAV